VIRGPGLRSGLDPIRLGIAVRAITQGGGVGRHVACLVGALEGVEPSLWTLHDNVHLPNTTVVSGPPLGRFRRYIPQAQIFQKKIDGARAAGQIDLAHAQDQVLLRPDVMTFHSSWEQFVRIAMRRRYRLFHPTNWYLRPHERRVARRARQVIAVSEGVAQALTRHHGLDPDRVHAIYNGVDRRMFHPHGDGQKIRRRHQIPADAPVVLFVGNEAERKGLPVVLEALTRMPRWHLLVVGQAATEEITPRVASLGLANRAHLAGRVPEKELVDHYAAGTAFALPSTYEPCALVLLEAMACGRPVVTTRNDGALGMVRDEKDGLLLDLPPKADAVAAALERVADDAKAMGRNARERTAKFTWESNARQTRVVYEQALRR
jgi:glycosyltransferase involved in cell wall biosynthesis